MQSRVLDDKDNKVMEAFLQNPDFRNYGFFAAQGNLNAYAAQYPKADPPSAIAKESHHQAAKVYSQADIKGSVPLGLLSQMSGRPPVEVASQNFMQPNLNLMRPKPDEVQNLAQAQNLAQFELALRMRLNEQAFVQTTQQQQQTQNDKVKHAVLQQQQQTVAAAFRRNIQPPSNPDPCHSHRAGAPGGNQQHESLIAYPPREPHLPTPSPQREAHMPAPSTTPSDAQSQRAEFVSIGPNRGTNQEVEVSRSNQLPAGIASAMSAQAQATFSAMSQRTSVSTPVSPEMDTAPPPAKKCLPIIPPESIAAFMREMQNLASTEVGKAVIPPQTLASIMQEMRQNAAEILSETQKVHQPIRVKSEFAENTEQQRPVSTEQQQFVVNTSSATDAKMKSELATQSLFAFNHELRMKGLTSHPQPMPLVVQPDRSCAGSANDKSISDMSPFSPLPPLPTSQDLFATNMSTKPTKKPKDRPHVCAVCHMAFTQKNHLQVHERKHTGEKPYRCTMCDSAFARKDGLVIHQRKHTGEKPYKCSFCSSAFTRKDKMVIHERTHTGERPYQCMQCDSKYTRKDKLTLHLRKHALAAQKELEKALQSSSALASTFNLQTGGGPSGLNQAQSAAANLSLSTAASLVATSGVEGHQSVSMAMPHNTVNAGNLGLQNTLAANLTLPTVAASNLQHTLAGNLTLAAANLNAVAANLSLQTVGGGLSLGDASPANLSLHDGTVTDLSLHDAGATNLSTTPLTSGS